MKLSRDQKENLLNAATQVYKGYVALDFFKTRAFQVEHNQLTLEQICTSAIRDGQLKQTITLSGQVFELELTKDSANSYQVSFKRPVSTASKKPSRKPLNDYDDSDALALLAQQNFSLEVDKEAKLQVANKLNEKTTLGGIGKIDLYRSHLVTLNNIIEKISAEEDISNLLVALATGSGKTYVQALWILVLSLSGNNAIFAVPDKLVTQLRNDLRRVLPNSLVDELLVLRENEENPAAEEVLNDLKTPTKSSRIIIGSSERLLDKHYQQLLEADPARTFLSFDEQHLLMKSERRRVRLIELSKKMLSMFLTATPNQETYQLSGNKPVAIMSSGQKQAAGQGQFPVLFSENARNISDRNKLRNYYFWTGAFWRNMFYGILLRFSNAIQKEQSSAAVSIVESLPFYLHRKPGETDVRWSMQVPMARKMLCIIDDNETLVNFCHALEHSDRRDCSVYHNGNLIDRRAIANFFQLPDVDDDLVREDLRYRQEEYRQKLNADEFNIGYNVVAKSLKEQIQDNIFHNMMEYVLTDLTGLDEIEHNRLRKTDPAGFQALIREKFKVRSVAHYQRKLATLIDAAGAQEIAVILNQMSVQLGKMHGGEFVSHWVTYTEEDFNRFVDNWALNDEIIKRMKDADRELWNKFDSYAGRHLMISVMTGMQASETPIEESRPFLGLNEDRYSMYHDGVLREQAKRRQRTSLETLNDTSMESAFTPEYQNFNEEISDNYFRLGFVGVYVSNKKTEGFSDRNLHTVINLAEDKLSTTNSPDTLIQGIGRNRGLDDTIVPAYIHALGREQGTVFDLEHLKSNDYYPELFKSQKSYNQQFIAVLGKNVGEEIVQWFRANVDKDETIDDDKLKKQVLKIIAKSLRQLNNNNSHNIQLSRSQLTKVIGAAMNTLGEEIARIKKPYKLTLSIRILGSILNFICEIYYSIKRIWPALQRLKHSWFGARSPLDEGAVSTKHPDDVYIKIINKTDFKTLMADISVAREFKDWIARKGAGLETAIRKNAEFYLKEELKENLNKHKEEFVGPLLSKFVVPAKRETLLQAIKTMPNLIGFMEKNKDSLLAIWESTDEANLSEKILQILQQIPSLDALTLEDIINYPEQIKADLASFAEGPLALLSQNPTLRKEIITNLAGYLKGPFLSLASAFFLDADLNVLKEVLQQEGNVEKFLAHLLDKAKEETFQITDLRGVIAEFKTFFKLDNFNSLEVRAVECMESLTKEMEALGGNPLANLKDEEITKIAKIIKEELLPSLVNVYPLANRQAILNEASIEKVKELVKTEGASLMEAATDNTTEIAASICSKLVSTPLPMPLDIGEEASRIQENLTKKFSAVLTTSKVDLGIKKVFTPSSWFGTLDNPQYIYDVPVIEIIQGKDFIDGLSLMLSFNEWQDVAGKIKKDSEGTLKLARTLIDSQIKGERGALSPEKLIELINQSYATQYVGAEARAAAAFVKLQQQQKLLAGDPINSLAPESLAGLAAIVRAKLMPLLAAFIQDSVVRENFLKQLSADNSKIGQFVFNNREKLTQLQTDNVEEGKAVALDLINQLLPPEQQLGIEQIIHLINNAEAKSEQLVTDLSENTVTSYLTSAYFAEFAEKIFNSQDYGKLSLFLQNKEKVAGIAKKIAAMGIQAMTQDQLIAFFKEDESLKDIQTLDKRMEAFGDFIREVLNGGLASVDKTKLSALAVEKLEPVFFHPEFYASLKGLVGFLNEEDITVMLEAMGKPEPKAQAAMVVQFMKIIKTQDKKALQEKFMTFPAEGETSLDELPIRKTVELLGNLIQEVLDCQCMYNQHDNKGDQRSSITPKLYDKLSPELRNINVDASYSFFSGFSRKIFFIQAIRNGLPRCAQVSGDSNQSQVKVLERVKTHILRPLWWGTNMSNIGYAIVKMGRNAAFALRACGFALLNGLKAVLNLFTGGYFTISSRNPMSADYNDTAFDMAETINGLTPFDAPKVATTDCPTDVVIGFETSIATRRSPQFFTPASTQEMETGPSDSPQCCM
ncbi:DEAD/DEAH box helicase family protein [Legionella cardiaca]|uniref:DEAD/DEAH box helicase family protein n=1 Tax=Legionella cardiaca TaxID=1071983 RepID=A0ABY8ARK0_9GAMM|nr:DEAD/DEAH box helicase family protein [Legionella cardiaca]WED42851.1 DEAD/DEAH box helicase family protein [Legionella cardiaca]